MASRASTLLNKITDQNADLGTGIGRCRIGLGWVRVG